jgi:hypothetical protein
MKSDRYIDRRITYQVTFSEEYFLSDAAPTASLDLEVNHFGIENIPLSGPYTGYFRVYTKPDQVKDAFAVTAPVAKQAPFDQLIQVMPGENEAIHKGYQLPREIIKDGIYSLYIPKQAGTSADQYTVIVELPRGYRVESDSFESRENFGFWQGTLTTDIRLELKVVEDQSPPHLVLQQNRELNHVSIHFNEDLNQNFAEDPFSYEVIDLDIKHPEKTDQIRIRRVETTSKDVHIYLTGQTNQPEERYGVRLKNLRDTHGNILSNRQITVVQRLD